MTHWNEPPQLPRDHARNAAIVCLIALLAFLVALMMEWRA